MGQEHAATIDAERRSAFRGLRDQLVAAVDARLAEAEAAGLTPADLGGAEALAQRVAAAIPTCHPTAQLVGACYDTAGLARWLGISRQALRKRAAAHTVLACPSADGQLLYPAWQFDAAGKTIPHLAQLIALLAGADGAHRWRAARWLAAPSPDLPEQVSAADWLRRGGDPTPVLAGARADARCWAV